MVIYKPTRLAKENVVLQDGIALTIILISESPFADKLVSGASAIGASFCACLRRNPITIQIINIPLIILRVEVGED